MPEERLDKLRDKVRRFNHINEEICVKELLWKTPLDKDTRLRAEEKATGWVKQCRSTPEKQGLLNAFLQEYSLSSQEGVALMCLAEALLRVPDGRTADRLIAEKIHSGEWGSHNGQSDKLFVNAATWGLMLTGKIVYLDDGIIDNPSNWLRKLIGRLGEPAVRLGVRQSMKLMGQQYVLGQTIDEAIKRGKRKNVEGARFSFDMLGEGSRTFEDAKAYFQAYLDAIHEIGNHNKQDNVYDADGISVKLSALHPRYQFSQQQQVLSDMLPRVRELALEAKRFNIGFTIDAEEASRLDLSLDIFQALAEDSTLVGWEGLGFALQAYQKRALPVVDWLVKLAEMTGRRLMIRLVKGAYWDVEIKHSQEQGLPDYPVFTRKAHSDLSYQVCANRLLEFEQYIYPQFATHNAYTVATIMELAGGYSQLSQRMEFQRLHGMGELLYGEIASKLDQQFPLRIYAPVGNHSDLMPYLARRLLENGANSSFVNQLLDNKIPVNNIVRNIEDEVGALPGYRHSQIPLPRDIYRAANDKRDNSRGIDLDDPVTMINVAQGITESHQTTWQAGPIIGGSLLSGESNLLRSPADASIEVGHYSTASTQDIDRAIDLAAQAQPTWQESGPKNRARIIEKAASLMEQRTELLTGLISFEAGKTLGDGVSEVREAVDFCRYYAAQIRELSARYPDAKGLHQGRGVFVCISPWNYPLAIFVGQVVAALAAGNSVIAKPADQTPLIAGAAVQILHEAGVPGDVLHMLTGRGSTIGPQLTIKQQVAGVAFTGSTETAQQIQINLTRRGGAMPPFIAETGGQNAMLADSTSLPEQVIDDVINSAFLSAGQRCSALRVLFIQEEVADRIIRMLKGALKTLKIGEPWKLCTDLGPVIDHKAKQTLLDHIERMDREAIFIGKAELPEHCPEGHYIVPHIYELNSISQLHREVFGPILHIVRYKARDLDKVFQEINATGYGLTMGIHSRIEGFAREVFAKTRVGNTYINRNMVGAVVGVNPFGGQGLSGTGFKAGGPHYLLRFLNLWQGAEIEDNGQDADNNPLLQTSTETLLQNAHKAQWHWNLLGGERRSEFLSQALANTCDCVISDKVIAACQALLADAWIQFSNTIALPGPTGETNTLSLHGRGVLLVCLNEARLDAAIQQIFAALAAGNAVLIGAANKQQNAGAGLTNWLNNLLPKGLVSIVNTTDDIAALLAHDSLSGVAVQDGESLFASQTVMRLAQRTGAIIPLITHLKGPFALLPYAVEKTNTNNVVATGGNAMLLNLQENVS